MSVSSFVQLIVKCILHQTSAHQKHEKIVDCWLHLPVLHTCKTGRLGLLIMVFIMDEHKIDKVLRGGNGNELNCLKDLPSNIHGCERVN